MAPAKAFQHSQLRAFFVSPGVVVVRVGSQKIFAELDAFLLGGSLDLGRVVRVDDGGRLGLCRRAGLSALSRTSDQARSQ